MAERKNKSGSDVGPVEDDWDDWDEEEDEEAARFPRMGFLDHLDELRSRIFKMILAILISIIICWNFVDQVWVLLQGPAMKMLETAQQHNLERTKAKGDIKIALPDLPGLPKKLENSEEAHELRRYFRNWLEDANEDLQNQIVNLLVARDARLMQTAVTEAFFLKVKVAFLTGLVLCYPYLIFQIWAFVAPGLYRRERRLAFPFILFSTLFFIGGLAFGYYIAVPFAGTFLMGFGAEFVQLITINKYMDFLLTMMLGLGIVFEIPMAIFLLAKLGVATPRWLLKNFRYAILIIVIIAAVITPTGDPINLAIFSIPMIALYLLGVAIAAIWGPKGRGEEEEKEGWEDDYEETEPTEEDDGRESYDEEETSEETLAEDDSPPAHVSSGPAGEEKTTEGDEPETDIYTAGRKKVESREEKDSSASPKEKKSRKSKPSDAGKSDKKTTGTKNRKSRKSDKK